MQSRSMRTNRKFKKFVINPTFATINSIIQLGGMYFEYELMEAHWSHVLKKTRGNRLFKCIHGNHDHYTALNSEFGILY